MTLENERDYDVLHWCVRELFQSGDFLSIQEKATINYIIDTWESEGNLSCSDLSKLNDIYLETQKRKGYYFC